MCVVPGRYAWRVYVDCLVLSAAGGCLLDALALGAYAALRDATIPKLRLVQGEMPGELDVELDDDPSAVFPFPCEGVPVAVTFTQVGGNAVVDASQTEEGCADSTITLAINRKGAVCSVSTGGAAGLAPQALHAAVEASKQIAPALFARADGALARIADKGRKGDLASSGFDSTGGMDALALAMQLSGLGGESLGDVGTTLISRRGASAGEGASAKTKPVR